MSAGDLPPCVTSHRAFIHDRGGIQRIAELENLNQVKWSRVRDDISTASVSISAVYCDPQSDVINSIEPGRHELVIFRGDERVWEGPITLITYTATGVQISASDVLWYLSRTVMQSAYDNAYPNVTFTTTRAKTIIVNEMTRKNNAEIAAGVPSCNVLPFLVEHHTATDAKTSTTSEPYQYTVFEHVDNLAAKSGMDYTAIGRAIHLWDTHEAPFGQTPMVTEADFVGDMNLTAYGSELGTRCIATDGEGVAGVAGGVHPYYGLIERLVTSGDEDTGEDRPTQAELNSQAQRNLAGRTPTPLRLHIPDNSTVNPQGVLTIDNLVPGIWIPMVATVLTKRISQMQKLDDVSVTASAGQEVISVTMYPAPVGDLPEIEGA